MTLDLEAFSPSSALLGGAFIGAAAVLLWALAGRIAGVSGIAAGLLRPAKGEVGWRVCFLGGLVAGAVVAMILGVAPASPRVADDVPLLIAGGLLVGIGTRLAGGCTSGHGVCGLARLSRRSLVATVMFMAAAFATVYLMRHAAGGA